LCAWKASATKYTILYGDCTHTTRINELFSCVRDGSGKPGGAGAGARMRILFDKEMNTIIDEMNESLAI